MTVKELRKLLLDVDQDRIVIISRDSEGNGYSPMYNICVGKYKADTSWSGEIGLDKLTKSDIDAGYSEEDVLEDGELCIILTPRN